MSLEEGRDLTIWSDGSGQQMGADLLRKEWSASVASAAVEVSGTWDGLLHCLNPHRAREQLAGGLKDIFPCLGCRGTSLSK